MTTAAGLSTTGLSRLIVQLSLCLVRPPLAVHALAGLRESLRTTDMQKRRTRNNKQTKKEMTQGSIVTTTTPFLSPLLPPALPFVCVLALFHVLTGHLVSCRVQSVRMHLSLLSSNWPLVLHGSAPARPSRLDSILLCNEGCNTRRIPMEISS